MKALIVAAVSVFAMSAYAHDSATVQMKDATGKDVGTVSFMQMGKGVHVKYDAHDLPAGDHGIHIHEKGSCVAPDFKSAGGHFNPTHKDHGNKAKGGHHAGDLADLIVKADGTAHYEEMNNDLTMKHGEKNSVWQDGGIAVVVHAKPDDGMSQPAGNAGDRIACGALVAMPATDKK